MGNWILVVTTGTSSGAPGARTPPSWMSVFSALSENLTEGPLLRNFLHPLNREELDVVHCHPLGLQQQIPQVLIPRPRLINRRIFPLTAPTATDTRNLYRPQFHAPRAIPQLRPHLTGHFGDPLHDPRQHANASAQQAAIGRIDRLPVQVQLLGYVFQRRRPASPPHKEGKPFGVQRIIGYPSQLLLLHKTTTAARHSPELHLEIHSRIPA